MKIYRKSNVAQGVPIVPMLDILTILLIFFIVHTEFKHQVNVLQLTLPQTHHLSGKKEDDTLTLLEVGRTAPQSRIQVAASDGAPLCDLVEVLDTITEVGIPVEQVPLRINYAVQP